MSQWLRNIFLIQLIVGSEDFDIRVFKGDEIICEMTETEVWVKYFKNSQKLQYTFWRYTVPV